LRIALAAGAVAGLVVIAACTDTGKTITAPSSIRNASIGTGNFGQAKTLTLCVDATSPTGTYTFVTTQLNRSKTQGGFPGDGDGIALTGNGTFFGGTWYDPGDGGDGTAVANANEGVPYNLVITHGVAPTVGNGGCVVVLNRTVGDAAFMASIPPACNPPQQCGGVDDSFSAATIQFQSGSGVYNHTDCLLDDGVLIPQRANPPASFDTWKTPTGGLAYNNSTPPNYPCDQNNPIRGFVNFEHGATLTFVFDPLPPPSECVLGYPYGTLPAKTATVFNESGALSSYGRVGNEIRMWYTDEHSLTLGVDSVFVNNKAPLADDHVSYFAQIEHMPGSGAGTATGSPIKVGSTVTTGLRAALDGSGRPLHPALFITDITGLSDNATHTDPLFRAGDWQYGGAGLSGGIGGIAPNAVYGSWKGAVISIDSTKNPPTKTITPRADAFKNHKVVYAGAGAANAANGGNGNNPPAAAPDLGYSAELVWNISSLGLTPGHSYRLQFMVHDGDQNKTGGDVGEACLNIGPGSPDPVVLINPDA
jgi:hypothetical protein